jgi:hypothetical protein
MKTIRLFSNLQCSKIMHLALATLLFTPHTLFVSCGKGETDFTGDENPQVEVVFQIGDGMTTKIPTPEKELDYVDVAIFVFDAKTGDIVESGAWAAGETPRISLSPSTTYHWWAVANIPEGLLEESWTWKESTFTTQGEARLTDSGAQRLTMYATGEVTTPATGAKQVEVGLRRYCCKVSVGTIYIAFKNIYATPKTVSLGRVVLINAVGKVPYSGTPTEGDLWYNLGKPTVNPASPEGTMTYADYGGQAFGPDQSRKASCSLYAMPNPLKGGVPTRMSIELIIDGKPYWYPATLPAMVCNKHYLMESMVVRGPGSSDPDIPIQEDEVVFHVSVKPWGEPVETIIDFGK